jgi:hypothetical protein
MMIDPVSNQFGIVLKIEFLHQTRFMGADGLVADK